MALERDRKTGGAHDDAMRIKGRAVCRMGEIAKGNEPSKGGRPTLEKTRGGSSPSFPTGHMAALTEAGLSRDHAKDGPRVANIPKADFELGDGRPFHPYVWRVRARLPERYGQRCAVLVRGAMNSARVVFEDKSRVVSSRNFPRTARP